MLHILPLNFGFVSHTKIRLLLSLIESSNNQKLMLEYEKYQDLQAKTQKTQEEYERQITELENRKEEEVTRQRMQYTAQLEKLKNDLILVRRFSLVSIVRILQCVVCRNAKKTNNNLVIMKKPNDRSKKMPMKKFSN